MPGTPGQAKGSSEHEMLETTHPEQKTESPAVFDRFFLNEKSSEVHTSHSFRRILAVKKWCKKTMMKLLLALSVYIWRDVEGDNGLSWCNSSFSTCGMLLGRLRVASVWISGISELRTGHGTSMKTEPTCMVFLHENGIQSASEPGEKFVQDEQLENFMVKSVLFWETASESKKGPEKPEPPILWAGNC